MSDREVRIGPYAGPAGGWGSARSLARIMKRGHSGPDTLAALARQNKPGGVQCVSCAWGKPAHPHIAEFCENGAKATAWELTNLRVTPDFFRRHSVTELLGWADYDLEQAGRLTHPMRYDAAMDRYVAASWAEAFAAIGTGLKACDPQSVILYASGRASLETSYMWALFARMYGSHNLPDSSNMCHETTSVALKDAIGSPVATIKLEDYDHCDAIFSFGQNVATNSPRMLHNLQKAARRGCEIVTFNPLRERGWERFTNPQEAIAMATGRETRISSQYYQLKAGGDIAAMMGMCKYTIEADDAGEAVLDHGFIAEHCHGYEEFAAFVRATDWNRIEVESGLTRSEIETAARTYCNAKAVIGVYGMGLTQHRYGIDNVRMLVNLLLLRGNIGRPGAGPGPVRGHSNVQGQRTVGITEKPELAPLDKLKTQFGFEPPRTKGWDTVESCRAVLDGRASAFVGLGGNFLRAVPDHGPMEAAWGNLGLTVHITTKLNRTHLIPGQECWLLPCLGRMEADEQVTGAQAVTIEDSFSHIHGSLGKATPASPHLLSEPAIVAEIAKATLAANPLVSWDDWVADYGQVRDAISETYPEMFARYNERLFQPGGFWKGNAASHRIWKTPSGRAEFFVPRSLNASGVEDAPDRFRLMTVRSNAVQHHRLWL